MKPTSRYIPFLAFLALLLIILYLIISSDATSVIPGWHTTIFPPYHLAKMATGIALPFIAIGYWLLRKKAVNFYWLLFFLHFLITVASVIYIEFPVIFFNFYREDPDTWVSAVERRKSFVPVAIALLVAAQALFVYYFLRFRKASQNNQQL